MEVSAFGKRVGKKGRTKSFWTSPWLFDDFHAKFTKFTPQKTNATNKRHGVSVPSVLVDWSCGSRHRPASAGFFVHVCLFLPWSLCASMSSLPPIRPSPRAKWSVFGWPPKCPHSPDAHATFVAVVCAGAGGCGGGEHFCLGAIWAVQQCHSGRRM